MKVLKFPFQKRRAYQLFRMKQRRETIWMYGFAVGLILGMSAAFSMMKVFIVCSH